MLGDTDPKQLGEAVVPGTYRDHVLRQELAHALLFQRNPDADPRTSFPDVK